MADERGFGDFLAARAGRSGGAPAIHYEGEEIDFATLELRSRRAASGLAALGVTAGDRVALWLPNTPAWFDLNFACGRLGAIAVAVNTRFRAAEVEDIVGRSSAKVLAFSPGFKEIDFPGILADVDPEALRHLESVVLVDDGEVRTEGALAGRRIVRHGELLASEPMDEDHGGPEVPCNIFTTSGTTKAPKFVLHKQEALTLHGQAAARALNYDDPDAVILQGLPLCGVYGYVQAMASLAAERPMILMPSFDGSRAAQHIIDHQVTHMNGTDEMYRRMFDARKEPKPFPSLRRCGFAAFTADPYEMVAEADGRGVPLMGLYGMSEVQALFAAQPIDAPPERRALGGGVPISPETRVRVRDPESGRLLPDNEQGELELKGPSQMVGYFGNEEATAATITEDGYIRSGDLGYTVPDGFVYLARMGDALRLGGFLVSPMEISSYIEQHAAVAACQVVGINLSGAAQRAGTQAVAFVIPASGTEFSEKTLQNYCRAGMAKFKVPVRILRIDAFPVTQSANGVKIQLNKLRDAAMAEMSMQAAET